MQRLFHLFQIHFVAVIQHRKLNVVFLLFYAKHQLSGLTGFIKAVLQSVFYQGLQQQLDDLIVQHLGVNFIGRAKRVGKPLLLNVQIAADLGQFFRHLQLVDTVIERVAQHLRKIRDHFLNIIGAVFDRHPVDGIQCIVQKMRVDLRLQGAKLCFFFAHLGAVDFFGQPFAHFQHIFKVAVQDGNLIVSFVDRHSHLEIPGADLFHNVGKRQYGGRDMVCQQQRR